MVGSNCKGTLGLSHTSRHEIQQSHLPFESPRLRPTSGAVMKRNGSTCSRLLSANTGSFPLRPAVQAKNRLLTSRLPAPRLPHCFRPFAVCGRGIVTRYGQAAGSFAASCAFAGAFVWIMLTGSVSASLVTSPTATSMPRRVTCDISTPNPSRSAAIVKSHAGGTRP